MSPGCVDACGLADQQSQLLEALFAARQNDALAQCSELLAPLRQGPGDTLSRGLAAYRSHGRVLARRALANAFPAVAGRLGSDNFDALAAHFWRHSPPNSGDIAQWGGGLPTFLQTLPDLCEAEPWLADLARLEWALHGLVTAPDQAENLPSLARLVTDDPAHLTLALAPGVFCLHSPWPLALLMDEPDVDPPRRDSCQAIVAWRHGWRPRWREALPGELPLLAAWLAGHSLAEALDRAPALDLAAWLHQATHQGLLLGVADHLPGSG